MSDAKAPADTQAVEREVSAGTAPLGTESLDTVVFPGADSATPAEGTLVLEPNPQATVMMDGSATADQPVDRTLMMTPEPNGVATVNLAGDSSAGGSLSVNPAALSAEAATANISVQGYRILGELGRGGMGVVYKARQVGLNRTVALKMIIAGAHASGDQLLRFQAEAEAVAQLQHPNIVQVYDIGQRDGLPFFSLEFVDGKPLDRDLDGKPQPEQRAAELAETLARAMHYAHDRGIMHRDLKPANVLLTKAGVPKISDFGLAKQLEGESSQTKTGTIMGTPSYMAPEQGRGDKQINHLADVYALGSMLYEFMTGRPPFLAPTPLKTLMRLLHEEPVPPSKVQPGISRDLETICMKCLQKDPRRRYETAAALADDLHRFQVGEAILARRVSRTERAWRWCKRNPRTAILSSAVAVLLAVVAVSLSLTLLRMSRDRAAIAETRQQAEQRLEQATSAVSSGNFSRAQDLLRWSDPLLMSAPDLDEIRTTLDVLRSQVTVYAEFRNLLDRVRYLGLFGGTGTSAKARETSHELIGLYDQIEQRQEVGRHGWPPLNAHQQELLQEDIFEAFLVSSQIERSASLASDDQAKLAEATRLSIDWLNRAEKILPPTKALFVWRGGYREILGEKEAAKADFERAAQIEPTSAVDRFWHAFADYRRAEEALQKGDNKAAGNFYRLAATGFAKVIEVRPENFWAYFSWANCLPRLGDGYGAIVGYTTCVGIRPDVPWPYNNRGTIHFQLRELDRALADFNKAVAISPDDPTGYVKRGSYYFALPDYASAKADFTVALKLQPADAEVRRNHAVVSLLTKDLEGSLADWQELAGLVPQSYEPHYYQGAIYLGQQAYDKAAAELEIALEKKADDTQSLMARAMIRRWRDQPELALADINLIVDKLAPNRHDYLIERADLLRALGRDAEAMEDYQQCVTLNPKQTDGYLGLAYLYEKQNKLVLARECYERMIKADSAAAAVYLCRAEFLRSHHDYDGAIADCNLAAKIDPKSIIPELVRAGITAARGNPAQAVKDAEQLMTRGAPRDGKVLYAAACAFSLAAQAARAQTDDPEAAQMAKAYAERGAQFLADVVGVCFHDLQYPEHNRMAWDSALEGIRSLSQVQKLLAGRK
jgi:serine/threonine protein kinase/Tfp pilus assembly protein PilF